MEALAMDHVIMAGCDLHDVALVLKSAVDRGDPERSEFRNSPAGRRTMIASLQKRAAALGGARIVFAYEASGQGFGLYDELTEAGIEAHVLAPTRIARSPRHSRQKTDDRDAQQLLELVRGHVLAGNSLPDVWIPDQQTRDDRELVRMRLDIGDKITAVKAQVQGLLKRNQLRRPEATGKGWSIAFRGWLRCLARSRAESDSEPIGPGGRVALGSLLRQLGQLEAEEGRLDRYLIKLADTARYAEPLRRMTELCGVGVLTALVFLAEMGDLARFVNRRQIAAYLGLAPSSAESGEADDRKGHITHQGSSRVRKVLCQATWARVRCDPEERAAYERIKAKNPKKKKIAVVAAMRRLAIRLFHRGRDAILDNDSRSPDRTVQGGRPADS
jgi:transposase